MKGRIKRNLTKLLILTMLLTVRSTSAFAEDETPVINLGTFEDVTVSGGLSGGEIPTEDTGKEDRDISKARVYYNYERRYRNKPVELNIICIHEAVSGRHIPESGYRVSYLNNNRPGEATAVITGRKLNVFEMFGDCTSLKNVDLSGLNLSKTEDFEKMFENCNALETIDMADIDMSSAKYVEGMFMGCSSLKSVDLSATSWSGNPVSATDMFCNCKKLEEITLSEDFKPVNCSNMVYVPESNILKVKGNVSDEFKDNVFPLFKESNRFIGYVKLESLIELEGRTLEDCMFSMEMETDGGLSRSMAFNYASYGNKPELSATVYTPGSNTFTVEERYVSEKDGAIPVRTIPISEAANYTCEDAVRSRTVNIILNTDGSLSVE